MLRTFVRKLRQNLFGQKAAGKTAGRKPNSIRLGVEILEIREVMSATVPGFTLTNGNLYNTSISQTNPIDTGVQNFTVVNTEVYDLHANATLESMNRNGSGKVLLDTNVVKFEVNPVTGAAWSLDSSGNLDINGVLGWGGPSNPTKDFAFGSDGSLWKLNAAGELDWQNPQNGNLGDWNHWVKVDTGVVKLLANPVTGAAWSLDSSGNLDINGVLGWGGPSNPTKDFAFGSDGSLWKLNAAGELDWQNPQNGNLGDWNHWVKVDTGVVKLLANPVTGAVWSLDSTGNLYINRVLGWGGPSNPTKDFAFGGDGSLWKLNAAGELDWQNPQNGNLGDWNHWVKVDTGVVKLLANPVTGAAWSLDSSGNLDINGVLGWGGPSNPTKDFAFGSDGSLWKLNAAGELDWQNPQNGNLGDWNHWVKVDTGVVKLLANPVTGAVWSLDSTGNLYINRVLGWGGPSNPTKDFAFGGDGSLWKLNAAGELDWQNPQNGNLGDWNHWQQLATNVNSFAVAGDGSVFIMTYGLGLRNGTWCYLWTWHANGMLTQVLNSSGQAATVASNCLAVAPDGVVYRLDTDAVGHTTLYCYTPGIGWTVVRPGTSVTDFGSTKPNWLRIAGF